MCKTLTAAYWCILGSLSLKVQSDNLRRLRSNSKFKAKCWHPELGMTNG